MENLKDIGSNGCKTVPSVSKLTCLECGEAFKHKTLYEQHIKTHGNLPYQRQKLTCHYCGKEYIRKDKLKKHLEIHEVKLVCKICNKLYKSKACLEKHELAHKGYGRFCCRQCKKVFSSEAERKKHKNTEHARIFNCSTCNDKFETEDMYASHKKVCFKTTQFVCESCGKMFKLKGNLKIHVDSKCGTERVYKCSECEKSFMTRSGLISHSLLHTEEKGSVCKYCGKCYRMKYQMQRHMLSHTGNKPFPCKVCLKRFAHRESLITHSTLHTGIKPYLCNGCGKGFSCIGNLIKHRKNHAKCMVDDSKSNQPRIKKPAFKSLLLESTDYESLVKPNPSNRISIKSNVVSSPTNTLPSPSKPHSDPPQMINQLQGSPGIQEGSDIKLNVNPNLLIEAQRIDNLNKSHANKSQCPDTRPPCAKFNQWQFPEHSKNTTNSEPPSSTQPQQKVTTKWSNKIPLNVTIPQLVPFEIVVSDKNDSIQTSGDSPSFNQLRCRSPKFLFDSPVPDNLDPNKSLRSLLQCGEKFTDLPDKHNYSQLQQPYMAVGADNLSPSSNSNSDYTDSISVNQNVAKSKVPKKNLIKPAFENKYRPITWIHDEVDNGPAPQSSDSDKSIEMATSISVKMPMQRNEDTKFFCTVCGKCFLKKECLELHSKTHDFQFATTNQTEQSLESEDDKPLSMRLQRHIITLKAEKEFPCQFCHQHFESRKKRTSHTRKHHKDDRKQHFPCNFCPKVYTFKRSLLKHEERHSGGTFMCTKCDLSFKVFKEYQCHVRKTHWKSKPFMCQNCGVVFQTRSSLNSHVKHNHLEAKRLVCNTCGKTFKHDVNLQTHIKARCGKSPSFVCKTCGKCYLSAGGFQAHQETHNVSPVFLCKHCGRDFNHKAVLLTHELTHTGEKPFVCPVCSKAFAHQISLTTHSTVHSGVKPYQCEGCGARFSCFGNLKKHRLTHMNTCSLTKIRKTP